MSSNKNDYYYYRYFRLILSIDNFLEAPPGADVFTNDTAHEGIRKYSKTYIPYEKDLSR